jgi:hypothetical protein
LHPHLSFPPSSFFILMFIFPHPPSTSLSFFSPILFLHPYLSFPPSSFDILTFLFSYPPSASLRFFFTIINHSYSTS